jgi:hypothetical protein
MIEKSVVQEKVFKKEKSSSSFGKSTSTSDLTNMSNSAQILSIDANCGEDRTWHGNCQINSCAFWHKLLKEKENLVDMQVHVVVDFEPSRRQLCPDLYGGDKWEEFVPSC